MHYLIGKADVMFPVNDFTFCEDFINGVPGSPWTSFANGTGNSIAAATTGHIVNFASGTTVNNENYLMTKKIFIIEAGMSILGRARVSFTQADTNNANLFVGFSSSAATGALTSASGVSTSISAVGALLKAGSLYWNAFNGISATQNTDASKTLGGVASRYHMVDVLATFDAVNANVEIYVDGAPLKDAYGFNVTQTFAWSGIADMGFGVFQRVQSAVSQPIAIDTLCFGHSRKTS